MKERITLEMTTQDAIMTMCHGSGGYNPGAMTACMQIVANGQKIDADNALGGLGPILMLDTLGIYAEKIWMLWSDVCKKDTAKAIACLRAVQLGLISEHKINHAIDSWGEGIDLNEIMTAVQERLPGFNAHEGGGDQ